MVRLATNYRLPPDVDIPQLVHTELRRMFMEESGLELVRPDIDISFSSPAGYLRAAGGRQGARMGSGSAPRPAAEARRAGAELADRGL